MIVRAPRSARGKYALQLCVVFAAYLVAGRIGLAAPFTSGNVSLVWPAAGVALTAMLLLGYRMWPAIAAGAFVVNALTAVPPIAALGLAIGNTAGPAAGAWLMGRIAGARPSLTRVREVLGMLVAAPLSAAASALAGVTVLFAAGLHPWASFTGAMWIWWIGDAMGILLVAPLALTLSGERFHPHRKAAELLALLASAGGTCLLMFHPAVDIQSGVVMAAAMTPFLLWAAIRFETFGAAAVVLLVASIVIWMTARGHGPFSGGTVVHDVALFQAFLVVLTVSGLTLAASIAERSHLIRAQARQEGAAESDRKHRRIIDTANEGIWVLDDRLVTVFANQRLATLLGYSIDEMMGRSLFDFVFAERIGVTPFNLNVARQPPSEQIQQRYRRRDGSELWALVARTPTFDESGNFTGVLKMVSDITAFKLAEEERQHARETVLLLSEAVNQTADSVVLTDGKGVIQYVNRAFETTTGYTREEAVGQTPRILKSGQQDEAYYAHMWSVLLSGETFHGTLVNARKNGENFWAEQTITPMKNVRGEITHFVSVVKDVTVARRNQEQQTQLRLAREVQQRFYTITDCVQGFELAASAHPAEQTGGDYFDVIRSGDRCYLAIGDVSGHGLDAALVMAMTRAYVRSFASLRLDVGEILSRVNEVLVADLQDHRYVTLMLASLDPAARAIEYANAGHVPGFVLNGAGEVGTRMDSTGVPLGLFPGAVFSSRRFVLADDDVLILTTDGAMETTTAGDEEFGTERMLENIRSHQADGAGDIAEGVYRAARGFAAGEPQHDDITTVVVKVGRRAQGVAVGEAQGLPLPALRL